MDITDEKLEALAEYLDIEEEDMEIVWGGEAVEADGGEYRVFTDSEADRACRSYIRDTLWAFNADFLIGFTNLPNDAVEMISNFQESKAEDSNEAIYSLVEDKFNSLVKDAILSDGRGHFLSPYDGEEIEEGDFFIYRYN